MIFFYTGASQDNIQQNSPSKSLGGYISSTIIPNSLIGNIFPSISYRNVTDGVEQIRAIALKNTFPTVLSNIKIYTTTPEDSIGFLTIGLVTPFVDSCDKPYLEFIQVEDQSPYYVEFLEVEGVDNAITISSLEPNQIVGLWIKRTVTQSEEYNLSDPSATCAVLAQRLEDLEINNDSEVIGITVSWGESTIDDIYYGSVSSIPSTELEVKALTFNEGSSPIIVETGTVNKIFTVVTVAPKTISSVIDLTIGSGPFSDITSEYTLNSQVTVDGVLRNIYVMQQLVPYTSNHQHKITFND